MSLENLPRNSNFTTVGKVLGNLSICEELLWRGLCHPPNWKAETRVTCREPNVSRGSFAPGPATCGSCSSIRGMIVCYFAAN